MQPTGTHLGDIGQIAVRVIDMERAVKFYRDALGIKFLFQAGPRLAFFDCNGVRLMLDLPEESDFDHPSSIIYFRVPNIQEAYRDLGTRGVVFRGEPHLIARMPDHELWMAFFDDTEGNVMAVMAEVRP